MKTVVVKKPIVDFTWLACGETFIWEGGLYGKVDDRQAVTIDSYQLIPFLGKEQCRIVRPTVRVWE